jgi:hypothetical protein
MDSTCPCCGEGEEDLEHFLRTCPELESPRKKNFVQFPRPLSALTTDQAESARYFREVFDWDLLRPLLQKKPTTTTTATFYFLLGPFLAHFLGSSGAPLGLLPGPPPQGPPGARAR